MFDHVLILRLLYKTSVLITAPLGLEFYTGNMFPSSYKNQIIIAEHGSWNREKKIGYRLMLVKLDGNKAVSYEPFAEGWLNDETDEAWGRPG